MALSDGYLLDRDKNRMAYFGGGPKDGDGRYLWTDYLQYFKHKAPTPFFLIAMAII